MTALTGALRPADGANAIEFLDPAEPFALKPVIADILRTSYCIPGSVFLVEGLDPSIAAGKGEYRVVRLLLGDGDLCIQALLDGGLHGLVDDGQVYVGCYIQTGQFEVRWADVSGSCIEDVENDGAGNLVEGQKKRSAASQKTVYLIVRSLATVGWDNAYLDMLSHSPAQPDATKGSPDGCGSSMRVVSGSLHQGRDTLFPRPDAPSQRPEQLLNSTEVEIHSELPLQERLSDEDDHSKDAARQRPPSREIGRPKSAGAISTVRVRRGDHLPWASDDPTKQVRLTPLCSIPNLPYKQNWMVNILAVVASLSDVESTYLAPYYQRTARLADPSTGKQVLLTVLLDPDDFTPKVGSVVLLLGVKNHTFDGGSLRKYPSDRTKNGGPWWFEEPWELDWCDVTGMKAWWESR